MLKIIACDDDVAFLDRLHRMIDRWSTETGTTVDVALVTRGEDLLARHAASRADIILLDMIMPLVNGMDTARELRQADTAVRLVFLTSSPEFALESYEVRAFDYLLKPVTYERLAQLLDELSSMRPAATDELVIKTSFGYHALRLSDIEYAEAKTPKSNVVAWWIAQRTISTEETISVSHPQSAPQSRRLGIPACSCAKAGCTRPSA